MNDNKFWEIQQIIEQAFLSDIESVKDKKTLLTLCMQYSTTGKPPVDIPEEMQYQLVDAATIALNWCQKQKITAPEIIDYILQLSFFATLIKIMRSPAEYHFSLEDFPDTFTVTWLTLQEKSFDETYKLLASQNSMILQKLLGDAVLNNLRVKCVKSANWVNVNENNIISCNLYLGAIALYAVLFHNAIIADPEQRENMGNFIIALLVIAGVLSLTIYKLSQNVDNWKKYLQPADILFFTSPKLALPNHAENLNIVEIPNHSRQV